MITQAPPQDSAILSRLFDAAPAAFSLEFAKYLSQLQFGSDDQDRMHELAAKARDGELNEAEQIEIESFERVGQILNIMQAKARIRLRQTEAES